MPIWNSSSLPLNYLIHNDSPPKKKNLIHNKHAHNDGKEVDLHSMRVGTWDSFTHGKEGGSFFVEERDGSSSSALESDELEAMPELWKQQWWQRERLGLVWTGFGLLWQWIEREVAAQGRERKKIVETTLLVPEVYPVCAIGPSSLKQAQLVP